MKIFIFLKNAVSATPRCEGRFKGGGNTPRLGLHELESFHNFHWQAGFEERSMENSPHLTFLEKVDTGLKRCTCGVTKFGLLSVETKVVHVKVTLMQRGSYVNSSCQG